MNLKEQLKNLGSLLSKDVEANSESNAAAHAENAKKAAIEEVEARKADPKTALIADMVTREEFKEFTNSLEAFANTMVKFIEEQPTEDETHQNIKDAVNDAMTLFIKEIRSNGKPVQDRTFKEVEVEKSQDFSGFNEKVNAISKNKTDFYNNIKR